jgi:hypothetical protein
MKSQAEISEELAVSLEEFCKNIKPSKTALRLFVVHWLFDNGIRFLEVEGVETSLSLVTEDKIC